MLILVRHGRTAHNASRRLLGRLDPPLDDLGLRQAEAIGAAGILAGAGRVVSSPLLRARQSAAAARPDVTVDVDERWTEIDYGVHDGVPVADAPSELFERWADDPEWAPEGGESMGSLGRRVREACEALWAEAAESDVVVVTHVSPIKAAVCWALGLPESSQLRLFVETASVHRIGPGRTGPALWSFNEVHHRPGR